MASLVKRVIGVHSNTVGIGSERKNKDTDQTSSSRFCRRQKVSQRKKGASSVLFVREKTYRNTHFPSSTMAKPSQNKPYGMIKVNSRQYSLSHGSETVRRYFRIRCAIQKTISLGFRIIAGYPPRSARSVGGDMDRIPNDDENPGGSL